VGGEPATVEITLADVRRILAERIQGSSRRPDFSGALSQFSSLTPLRWLPFRVICILGLDEAGTSGAGAIDATIWLPLPRWLAIETRARKSAKRCSKRFSPPVTTSS